MASDDPIHVCHPQAGMWPDADAAEAAWILKASSDEPDYQIPVLDFDPGATNEHMSWQFAMPDNYDGGGITVRIYWSSGATSGNVKWDGAFTSYSDDADDTDSKAYATVQSTTQATASAAGEIQYTDIAFTDGGQIDNLAAGELGHFRLTRDSADAADTMNSNDARVHLVTLKET
jgi:hypothetical protein